MNWGEIIQKSKNLGFTKQQIFQEETQKTILTTLSHEGAFNDIVFQGGTSLRFFYGNPRHSEDLDFVLRKEKQYYDLTKKLGKIKTNLKNIFPFIENIKTNIQKNNNQLQRIRISTISEITDQKLRINIELANIPSYQNQPKILNYPPLNPAVRVEQPQEILADKITALANRPYIKGRDIWDIYFLIVEKQIKISWNLVNQKAYDYNTTPKKLRQKLQNTSERLDKEGLSILTNEMKRFLPTPLIDQYSEQFPKILTKVSQEIQGERQ